MKKAEINLRAILLGFGKAINRHLFNEFCGCCGGLPIREVTERPPGYICTFL